MNNNILDFEFFFLASIGKCKAKLLESGTEGTKQKKKWGRKKGFDCVCISWLGHKHDDVIRPFEMKLASGQRAYLSLSLSISLVSPMYVYIRIHSIRLGSYSYSVCTISAEQKRRLHFGYVGCTCALCTFSSKCWRTDARASRENNFVYRPILLHKHTTTSTHICETLSICLCLTRERKREKESRFHLFDRYSPSLAVDI